MIANLYFFIIPVYRLSQDDYLAQMAEEKNKVFTPEKETFLENNPNYKILAEEAFIKSYGGKWEFNEILGYIKLHILGTQVRGEYYENDKKRHVKTRIKQFTYITHKLAIEVELPLQKNNTSIYLAILNYLGRCAKDKKLRNRFVDISYFKKIGPYIDWLKLINEQNKMEIS